MSGVIYLVQNDDSERLLEMTDTAYDQEFVGRAGAVEVEVFKRILQWSEQRELSSWFGTGAQYGTCYPTYPTLMHKGECSWVFALLTYGSVEIEFGTMKTKPPLSDDKRREIVRRLNEIPGARIPENRLSGYPTIPLSRIIDEAALRQFLSVFGWVVEEVRRL
ncbi:MAG TPA: hypothetical protein VFU72_06270 [Nitrolancea sp.]|nr:hypothetical protein [Nitrolancea sp.]